jgi:ribonuclease G
LKKQVLVSVDRGETRVALLEASGTPAPRKTASGAARRRRKPAASSEYKVAELYLERRGNRSIVGNIYKGRVDNVLAGLEAAFVDIGLEKNGFLHVDEIVLPGVEAPRRGRGGTRDGRNITDLLKPGQEIVVQVVKDPLKTKGARLSMDLTIAGRYMVYAPYGEGVGVSRRLDEKERERLRKEAAKLELKGAGAIIRTSAQGAKRADLERELVYLFKLGEVLASRRPRPRRSSSRRPTSRFGSYATSSRRTSNARSSTIPSSCAGWCHSSAAPRPSWSIRSTCGRRRHRCSRPSASRTCSPRRSRAGSTFPAAAI